MSHLDFPSFPPFVSMDFSYFYLRSSLLALSHVCSSDSVIFRRHQKAGGRRPRAYDRRCDEFSEQDKVVRVYCGVVFKLMMMG